MKQVPVDWNQSPTHNPTLHKLSGHHILTLELQILHTKIYAPSSSLLQGKHLPFSPSPLRRLFVILSPTQLYRSTTEIFLFSTATFKYTYQDPLRRIGQEKSANVAF
jgi:hypothetical protein